jgi:hypothetical protein
MKSILNILETIDRRLKARRLRRRLRRMAAAPAPPTLEAIRITAEATGQPASAVLEKMLNH